MPTAVLVITGEFDPSADIVITRLRERDVPVFRFDLADFPEHLTLSGAFSTATSRWQGTLANEHRSVDLADIAHVWYRKPTPIQMHDAMTTMERQWATVEARHGFGGLLAALRCGWINHPHRNAEAERKPAQLAAATTCGLTVPDTLITNSPAAAREFCADHPDGTIYKAFRGVPRSESGQMVGIYTNRVVAEDITDAVGRTAHMFQEAVPKAHEVRLTVVAGRLFGLRLDATTPAGKQDWRADHETLQYDAIDVPARIADGVHALMAYFRLTFGALDFVVTPGGHWVFLEINPNGQWAWDHPQTDAIADALTDALTEGTQ